MTKREAFTVALRLTGIWKFLYVLWQLASVSYVLSVGDDQQQGMREALMSHAVSVVLILMLAAFLTFGAQTISRWLIPEDAPLDLGRVEQLDGPVLALYCKLLGLLMLVSGVIGLIGFLASAITYRLVITAWHQSSAPLISPIATTIVGIALIVWANAIASVLSRSGSPDPASVPDSPFPPADI